MLQKSLRAQILALIGGSLLLTLLIALGCIRMLSSGTTRSMDSWIGAAFST